MSEIITFNTKDAIDSRKLDKPIIPTFTLINEDSLVLRQAIPEFNFEKPSIDANAFASTLVETCKKHQGIGLSANQCGYGHRVFVMGSGDEYVAFFNPKVIASRGEAHLIEGCLSFPLLGLRITRAKEIDVEYQDFTGKQHFATFNGISARCFLHELDHMNGIVYTDRVKPLALKSGLTKSKKLMDRIAKSQASKIIAERIGNNVKNAY
jgi:peptide deformylase